MNQPIILVLIALGSLCPNLTAQEMLQIGTFNCEFLTSAKVHIKFGYPFELREPDDIAFWSQEGMRARKFNQAVEAVASTMAKLSPDIWCLVEVGTDPEVAALQTALRELGHDYPHRAVGISLDSVTGQHVAVLSKLPIETIAARIEGRAYYDAEPDDWDSERMTVLEKGIHVQVSFSQHTIHLFVVHLTSEMGGHDRDQKRIAQATIVRRAYLPYLNRGEDVIVVGDLNDGINQPAIRRIKGRDDVFEPLVQTASKEYIPKREWNQRWTYNWQGQRNLLDHILISQSLAFACPQHPCIQTHIEPLDVDPMRREKGDLEVSDHRPIVVVIDLPSQVQSSQ